MKNYGVVRFVDTCKPVPHGKDWIGISVGADKFNALTGGYCRYRKIGKHSDNHFYMITFKLDGKRYRFCSFGRDVEKMSVQITDCTIRDGGYLFNKNSDPKFVKGIIVRYH